MVDFKFHCPGCNQKMQASDDMIGDKVECPVCRREFEVPAPPRPEVHCAFCSGNIPPDSVYCDLCGKRQPDPDDQPSVPAMAPPPKRRRHPGIFWLLLLVVVIGAAAFYFLRLRRPPPVAQPPATYSPAAVSLPSAVSAPPAAAGPRPPVVRDVTSEVGLAAPAVAPASEDVDEDGEDADEPPSPAPHPPAASPAVARPVAPPAPAPLSALQDDETEADADDGVNEVLIIFEKTRDRYREVCQGIEKEHLKRINGASESFIGSLEGAERAMQERGELMGVLAVRKEKEEFQQITGSPPVIRNTASDYAEIAALKNDFNKRLELLRQERDEEKNLRSRQYDARLAALERQLTQAGRIEQALLVHQERESLRQSLGSP